MQYLADAIEDYEARAELNTTGIIEWDPLLGEINQWKYMLNLRGFPLVPCVGNIMTSIEWYFVMDKNPVCIN